MTDFDIIICGGGIIGITLARALAHLPLRIALIEAKQQTRQVEEDNDARSIGLTLASQVLLEHYGLWNTLATQARPLRHIQITDKGYFGATRLHAADYQLAAFGYILPMHHLQNTMQQSLHEQDNLTLFCPAKIEAIDQHAHSVNIMLDDQQVITSQLLVAADGQRSWIRDYLNIDVTQWDYQQQALVTNVTFSLANEDTAYERFTKTGPLAVLPRDGQRCGLVWTIPQQQTEIIKQTPKTELIEKIQTQFGYRLGHIIDMGKHFLYPLSMIQTQQYTHDRVVLVGNAAQSLHPVAAQGLNLGLRDVATLAKQLETAHHQQQDLGTNELLKQYTQQRLADQKHTRTLTDGLVRLFSNDFIPLVVARNLGLVAIDILPHCKTRLVKRLTHKRLLKQLGYDHATTL